MTTAGFRFIPVDPHIVEPPVRFDQLNLSKPLPNGSVSGSLQITWTAETPVCVGDSGDPVRPIQIGGAYVLPGASLRGMVRAVAEIATFSHLGHINAARHYGVRTYDQKDMPPVPQQHGAGDLKAGWLVYSPDPQGRPEKGEWRLKECAVPVSGYNRGYWHVKFDQLFSAAVAGFTADTWRAATLQAKYDALVAVSLNKQVTWYDFGSDEMTGAPNLAQAVPNPGWTQTQRTQKRAAGFIVCAGPIDKPPPGHQPRMRETLFAPPRNTHAGHLLSRSFMTLFHGLHSNPGRNDREPTHNWAFWLGKMGWPGVYGVCGTRDPAYRAYPGIPVFYHGDPAVVATDADGPMVTRPFFMGLTRVLRLPWPYSVGEVAHRLYNDHKDGEPRHYQVPRLGKPGGWDFARALFGEVDDAHMERAAARARAQVEGPARALAGRVSFGPAFAMGNPRPEPLRQGVFGTPRESFYPFYLARAANGSPSGTQRYDDPHAIPAGRKRYVVRRTPTPFPSGNANERTLTRIEYLPAGTQFTGTVRFHNLDPVELGALLWALSFGDWSGNRYRHQIGRGKAQGYGVMRADIAWRPPRIVNRDKIQPAGDPDKPETYLALFRDYMTKRLDRDFETTPQITALRCYADPAVGDRNQNLLITLPLEDHGGMTYPQLKRDFDEKGKEPGYPAGAKSALAPLM